MGKQSILTLVAAFLCLASATASANLIGDTITARWQFPPAFFDQSDNFLVGPGIEGNPWVSVTLDVSESSIDIDFLDLVIGQSEMTIWTFSSLDWLGTPGQIVGVVASTNWVGWSDDFISFGDDFVRIDFLNAVTFDGESDFLSLDLIVRHRAVPEPTTLLLLGLGLAALGFSRRRLH